MNNKENNQQATQQILKTTPEDDSQAAKIRDLSQLRLKISNPAIENLLKITNPLDTLKPSSAQTISKLGLKMPSRAIGNLLKITNPLDTLKPSSAQTISKLRLKMPSRAIGNLLKITNPLKVLRNDLANITKQLQVAETFSYQINKKRHLIIPNTIENSLQLSTQTRYAPHPLHKSIVRLQECVEDVHATQVHIEEQVNRFIYESAKKSSRDLCLNQNMLIVAILGLVISAGREFLKSNAIWEIYRLLFCSYLNIKNLTLFLWTTILLTGAYS